MSDAAKKAYRSRSLVAKLVACALAIAGMAGVSSISAQSFAPTRFPPQGAQYVEGSPMTQNWLFTGGNWLDGDQNGVNAVFFEIPDTTTQTLYFAVRNPNVCTPNNPTVSPDRYSSGTNPLVVYTLIGGTGAYSKAAGRHLSHTTSAATDGGTQLDAINAITYATAFDESWVYFNGVSPSQGEHIGNKYYFRLTAAAPNFVAGNGGPPDFKHAYQFDASFTNSGTPTGLSNAYAFSYDVTFAQLDASAETWDFYPYVPFGAGTPLNVTTGAFNWSNSVGQIAFVAGDWKDNGLNNQTPTPGVGSNYVTTSYVVTLAQTNGAWHLRVPVNTNMTTNGAGELYFDIGGSLLRIYATNPPVVTADHFTISPTSSSALNTGSLSYRVQVVDSSGNPIPYIKSLSVTASSGSGNARINGAVSPQPLTTDSTGGVNFTLTDSSAETVNLSIGTILVGANGTATATFNTSLPPTISSASNLSFNLGSAAILSTITITANGAGSIAANSDIVISLPPTAIAQFDTGYVPDVTGTASGKVNAAVVAGGAAGSITVHVNAVAFASGDTLILGANTKARFTTTNIVGSSSLRVTADGGTTYSSNDKVITVIDPNPTYVWSGASSGVWTLGTNWAGNTAPSLNNGTENIIIPNGCSNYPTIPALWSIHNLSLDTAASLSFAASNLTINGTISNAGRLIIGGTGRPSKNDVTKGTVLYNGAGQAITDFGATDYYNLSVAGSSSLASSIAVAGALTISSGSLSLGSQSLTTGSFSNSGTLVLNGDESINGGAGFTAAGNTQYIGTTDYTSTPGKLAAGNSYGTLSFAGAGGGKWILAADLSATSVSVAASDSLDLATYNVAVAAISNSGTLRLGGGTQTIAGGVTNNAGSTVVYYGVGAAALAAGYSYVNLTIAGSGAYTAASPLTVSGLLTVSGASGSLAAGGANTITAGDIDLSSGPSPSINAGASALTINASAGTNIYLGAASGTGLNLSSAELVKIAATGLTIAASGAGTITATSLDTTGATHGTLTLSGLAALSFSGATNTFVAGLSATTSLAAGISLGSSTELIANAITLGKIGIGTNSLTLSCDDLTLGASLSVTGTGAIVLRTRTVNRPITVNGTAAGSLSLSSGNLSALGANTFSSITIGQSTGTGVITIAAALGPIAFPAIDFVASSGIANLIQVNNSIQNSAAKNISFDGQTQLGSATVASTGGNINFNYPVTLADGAAATVSTSGTGVIAFAAGATIDGNSAAGLENLTLTSSGSTAISFGAAIGGSVPLNNVTIGAGAAQALPATTLDASGTLSVTANGAITQGGAIKGSALVAKTLNNAGAAITLTTATNDFATIDLRARNLADGLNAAGAIAYTDATSVSVTALQSSSTANLIATAGALSQSGAIACTTLTTSSTTGTTLGSANTVSAFTASNTVSGNISLTNTAAPLTIPIGGISEVAGGTVSIANTGAILLTGAIGAGSGTISLNTGAAGTITGSGLLTADTINLQTGTGSTGQIGTSAASPILSSTSTPGTTTTSLSLGQGSSLAGAYISHTGALTLSATSLATNAPLSVVASGLLTLPAAAISTGTAALNLQSGSTLGIGQNLGGATVTLTASGAITQTAGAITGTTLAVTTLNNVGAGITLSQAANDFANVSLRALDATGTTNAAGVIVYTDANGFAISGNGLRTSSTASLKATAAGAVTQSVAIQASGLELLGVGPFTLNSANAAPVIAGSLSGALSFTNNGALSVGTVNSLGLTSTSSVTLTATGATISQTQPIYTATSLSLTSTGGISFGAANTVASFTASNAGGGAVTLVNTAASLALGAITQAASGAISITNTGSATVGGAIGSSGGTIAITLNGAGNVLTNSSSITSGGGAITMVADDMILAGGTVSAGAAGAVSLSSNAITQIIDLGTNSLGNLGLLPAELNTITSGALTIGDLLHTGAIQITAICNPSLSPNVTLLNSSGGIDVGANFTANAGLTLTANAGSAASGAITQSGGTLAATGGSMSLNAATGIGVISTVKPVIVGTIGGNLAATNTTSGDLYILRSGSASLTLGSGTFGLSQYSGGALRVDSGGNIVIAGDITVAGAGSIELEATGTITEASAGAGILHANTVRLGLAGNTTSMGILAAPIVSTATTLLSSQTSAGAIFLSNTGAVSVAAAASGGLVNIQNAGNMTVANTVSGATGVTLSVSGAGNSFIHSAGTISASNAAIAIAADDFILSSGASTIAAVNGSITFAQTTNGRPVDLGTNTAGSLGLVATELLEPNTTGTFTVGNANTGAVTASAAIATTYAPNFAVTSGASVSGGGAISAGSFTVSAVSGIALSGASTVQAVQLSNSGSGNVGYTGSSVGGAATLTVGGSNAVAGGTFTVQETSGSLTVGAGGIATHGGAISLTTQKAAGLLTITGAVDTTAGPSPAGGNLTLVADDMSIGAALRAGTGGSLVLYPNDVTRAISLGGGASGLGLSNAELGNIYGQTSLSIGRATQSGQISADGAVDLLTPARYTGPLFLITTTGGIGLSTYAITTPGNLSLSSVGPVAGSGQLTIGALGASSLSATSSNGISLTNSGNLASVVSLTNGAASGNIVFNDDRNMSLTASNGFASGTITVVNGTGTMSVGALSTVGASGYISLSSAGAATQSAVITAPGGLELLGAGPYTLNSNNVVPAIAANVVGSLSFTAAAGYSVGTVNTAGITLTGAASTLSLNAAAGSITLSADIATNNGTVGLNRPTIVASNATITSGTALTSFASTVDDLPPPGTYSLKVAGAASFGGPVGGTSLASLWVTGTTSTGAGGTAITTSGTQRYDGTVTLGADAILTASSVSFNASVVGAAHALDVVGAATLGAVSTDSFTGLSSLSISLASTINAATVTTTGIQTYSGAVTLGTDLNFTAGAASLVWFKSTLDGVTTTRAITITTAPAQFDGAVGGIGNLVTSLDVTAGTTALNASVTTSGAQTYTGAVTLGASVSAISGAGAIGFISTVGQTGTRTLTVQDASSTGTVTFGGAVTLTGLATGAGNYAIALNNGGTITNAVTFSNTGGVTIAAGLTASSGLSSTTAGTNTFQGSVATDGATGHDISVSNLTIGASGLTLNAGSANFLFSAIVSVGNTVSGSPVDPVDDPTDLTIAAALIDGSMSGTLKLAQGATVDIGSSGFNIKTLTNPGQDVLINPAAKTYTRNAGIIRLTGTQATHLISSAGYGTSSGAFLYYGTGGTIFTTGLVDTSLAPGPYNYWDLIVDATGAFTPESDIVVRGSLRIRNGTVSAGSSPARQISIGGNWRNDVGAGGFTSGTEATSVVTFLGLNGPVFVWGDNDWFIFKCTIPGLAILFENQKTQVVATGGTFWVKSAGAHITLSRLNPGTLSPFLPDGVGNPGNPPTPIGGSDDSLVWFFDLRPGAAFNMGNVDVFYSNARDDPLSVPAGVTATPYSTHYCFKWLDIAYSIYSYTEDTDYNGKIDRIRVTTESSIDLALVDFSGFQVQVQGYDVDTSKGTNGYFVPSSGFTYYIYLKEKPYNDTGTTPDWRIVSNTTFRAGGKLIFTLSRAGGSDLMTPGDTAWPRVGYTLSIPGQTNSFVHMSEEVDPASTAADLGFAGGLVKVSGTIGVSEATGTLASAPTAVQLAQGSFTLNYTGGLSDLGKPPYWEAAYAGQVISFPAPTYPLSTGYAADPNSYLSFGASPITSLNLPTRPTYFDLQGGGLPSTSHRASDVLISLPPVTAADLTYFVWPIYAKDSVALSLSDNQIASLTPAQTAAQGIGLIRAFDGSQWLRAQDIKLQALMPGGIATTFGGVNLRFDSGVPSTLQSYGLWLPNFNETGFSGLVPYPNASPKGRGASPSIGTSIGSNLWNFSIPKSDPRIASSSTLGFFFISTTAPAPGVEPLYAARLDTTAGSPIPANWYRMVKPFSFDIHDVSLQKGGATILNNVIDPTKGETVRLSYQLASSGAVTITVFTLDGDVVARLANVSSQAAGDHSVYWNGRNLGGSPVARGLYFVRIVAPGMDEIRKVLVVRK